MKIFRLKLKFQLKPARASISSSRASARSSEMCSTFSKLRSTLLLPRPIYSQHNLRDSSTERSKTWRKYCLLPCNLATQARFGRPTFRHSLSFQGTRTSRGRASFAEFAIERYYVREAIETLKTVFTGSWIIGREKNASSQLLFPDHSWWCIGQLRNDPVLWI